MEELGEIIYTVLSSDPVVAIAVGEKIYPLIASQQAEAPFIVFTVEEGPLVSKNSAPDLTFSLACYHETYNASIALADRVKNCFIEADNIKLKYLGASPEYHAEKLISVNQNYKLKY